MGMFRKQGGGGVTGVITAVTFDIKDWPGKNGKQAYSTLSANVKLQADGATEAADRFLNAGFVYEGMSVSEDGTTLLNEAEGAIIQEDTEFARFIGSAIEKGVPESDLDETGRTFTGLVGYRVTLINEVDAEATKQFGKRKGKDGKEYNRTETRVSEVFGKEAVKGAKKSASKPAAKVAAKSDSPAVDTETADVVLGELLSIAPNKTIERGGLNAAMVKYAIKNGLKSPERDALRNTLMDTDYLAGAVGRGLISYKSDVKGEPISLA